MAAGGARSKDEREEEQEQGEGEGAGEEGSGLIGHNGGGGSAAAAATGAATRAVPAWMRGLAWTSAAAYIALGLFAAVHGRQASPLAAARIHNDNVLNKNALRSSAGGQYGGRVSVATVNTLESAPFYPMPGAPAYEFRNLGAGQVWQGMITKAQLYLAWIRAEAQRDPGGLWVLADGGDVGFGGCTEDDLVRRYMTVVAAGGGAQVVAGGDNFIWPPILTTQLGNYAGLQGKRPPMLAALGLDTNSYAPYEENGGVYTYVNSGFLMGPAAELLKVLECMNQHEMGWVLASWAKVEHYDDQLALTNCSFHMPETITVDFTGSIVLETMGFRPDLLYGSGGAIYNEATRTVQCFIHANGESSVTMETLQAMLLTTA